MGVSSTTNTEIYTGDGTTTAFAFPFYFFKTLDLYVYIYDLVALTITQQTPGVNFSVSGTPNAQGLYPSGGFVNMVAAPPATQKVVISRTPIETNVYALSQNGIISSTAIVQQFDFLTLLIQSLQDQINRCLQLPPGYAPVFNPDLPSALPANYLLGVNGAGNGVAATAGIPGPTGPQGPAGGSSVVLPATTSVTLAAGSPVNQQYIPCDATAGAMNVNLPAANLAAVGQIFQIKKVDSGGNAVTIVVNGIDHILTTSLLTTALLDYQGKSYSLICRAVGFWDVI